MAPDNVTTATGSTAFEAAMDMERLDTLNEFVDLDDANELTRGISSIGTGEGDGSTAGRLRDPRRCPMLGHVAAVLFSLATFWKFI